MLRTALLLISLVAYSVLLASDSSNIFSAKIFLLQVKNNHPLIRLGKINVEKAKAENRIARGSFDPIINYYLSEKNFDDINYYQKQNAGITFPTWFGMEIQTGIEYIAGERVDVMETPGKTNFTSISLPLAKNLLLDKRRAALKISESSILLSEQERKTITNNLLRDASEAYFTWVQTYLNLKIYDELLEANRKRVQLIISTVANGERPGIDTVEANAQLQSFQYLKNEAQLSFVKASIYLSNFLWTLEGQPYDLPEDAVPEESLSQLSNIKFKYNIEALINDADNVHPELLENKYKVDIMEINRRLKLQELLPKLDLKYTVLGKNYNIPSSVSKNFLDNNNQKLGLFFSFPVLNRSGRGEYKLAKLKLEENKWVFNQKYNNVVNKIKSFFNQLNNYEGQISLTQRTYNSYLALQKGEETKFFNGESSLFMINSRENKTLEALLKFSDAVVNYHKTNYLLLWAAGKLYSN